MITRLSILALVLTLASTAAAAQDPLAVAPQAYKLQFENEWVKVVRVHYEPREKIAAHDHPRRGTVFVYLRDGGPVRFSHTGAEPYALERPAIAARAYRIARPVDEHHEVENVSDLASDFLRVELKTEPVDVDTTRGRFPAPPVTASSGEAVERESGWIRTVRVTVGAGETYAAKEAARTPALLIAFAPMTVRTGVSSRALAVGDTLWLDAGASQSFTNAGSRPGELLRVEFRSKPAPDARPDAKGHTHR